MEVKKLTEKRDVGLHFPIQFSPVLLTILKMLGMFNARDIGLF
jgi:hypothetical protein